MTAYPATLTRIRVALRALGCEHADELRDFEAVAAAKNYLLTGAMPLRPTPNTYSRPPRMRDPRSRI